MADQRLAGRYILITGGGGGIGTALAQGLTKAGAKVFVADVRSETASEVATTLRGSGWTEVDVRDQASVERMVVKAVAHGGPLNGLVNAHGLSTYVPFLELSVEEWSRIIDVNLTGTFIVGQAWRGTWLNRAHRGLLSTLLPRWVGSAGQTGCITWPPRAG